MQYFRKGSLEEIVSLLENMKNEVILRMFTQTFESRFCKDSRDILSDLSELENRVNSHFLCFENEKEEVRKYGIDKIPCVLPLDRSEKDFGIRYYGDISGYCLSSLISTIIMISTGHLKLSNESKLFLNSINKELCLKVFVSTRCLYTQPAVNLANQLAFYSKSIETQIIDIDTFPDLVNKYHIQSVPRTLINDSEFVEGSVPEYILLNRIKSYLN